MYIPPEAVGFIAGFLSGIVFVIVALALLWRWERRRAGAR